MNRPEQRLQQTVAEYLSWALAPPAWFTAFPAGGGGERRGRIIKGMGLKAGVPDLFVLYGGRYYGLEMKAPKGVLSEPQRETHRLIHLAGCPIEVCRSLDDVQAVLALWGVPIRESKPAYAVRALAADLNASQTCDRLPAPRRR